MPINLTHANLDLLSIGIAIAAIALLGFVIYTNNPKSITNKSFLFLSIATIIWSISNYLEYKFTTITTSLWALRIHLFISTWHALSFFQLSYVFPLENIKFPKWYKFILIPIIVLTAISTLTPFVFSRIVSLAPPGQVTNPERGPGIVLFSLVAFGLLIAGVLILLIKTLKSKGIERQQSLFILLGMFLMACLILLFNVLLPVTFNNLVFIPFAALFVLPFISLTSYTIYKHKLFNIRVAATAFISFLVTAFSFINIIFSTQLTGIILNSTAFIIILIGSIQLIRGMLNLEVANDRLKELDEMKTEFVSLATHQIRAPLTAIKGYISLIQEGDYGLIPSEIKGALDVISQSTNSLVTIVGDFLDVSRIEQGRMKYEFTTFDVENLLEEVVTEYQPNLEKKGLKILYTAESGQYMTQGDKGKIKQVIGNIIDNSVKYTPQGRIDVTIKNQNNKILIKIADTGVGIPPQTMPKLFQKFTRAENANETNILGTGLGLYVAKEMIEAHHGQVWAESEGVGKGSQFYIELNIADSTNKKMTDANPFAN